MGVGTEPCCAARWNAALPSNDLMLHLKEPCMCMTTIARGHHKAKLLVELGGNVIALMIDNKYISAIWLRSNIVKNCLYCRESKPFALMTRIDHQTKYLPKPSCYINSKQGISNNFTLMQNCS